ncbi:MAG: hypothetical protein K1Y01_16950 [Vicinamibacteria bacterium]|nr:hypothetical protein [Vicinamibacteria bacterium]
MENSVLPGLVSLLILVGPAFAQMPSIVHQPVACVTAEKFPRFEARLAPPEQVAAARVVFQGQTTDWYSVAMKPEGPLFAGVLPKPKKDLKSFRYYIEVMDKAMGTNRTAEYTAAVVDSASACKDRVVAGALGSASVILQGPAGAAALPAGFASSGVVAGSAAGSGSAAGVSAAGAAGGGVGATALVIGGVAVAGGAAAVAASAGGGEDSSGSNSNQSIRLDVTIATSSTTATGPITTPFIDVSVCRPGTTFGGGPITLRSDGSFDETWSVSTPALRVAGRADANGLQATLNCVSGGGPTGSMSAAGSGYSLSGSFSFGSSQGTITVRRVQ